MSSSPRSSTAAVLDESARHHAATTAPLAAAAHSTLSNALTTPTPAELHDHERAPVDVVISDPESFARKRAQMVAAGAGALQVLSDFDRTLSAFITSSGAMCAASHQLLEACVGFDNTTFQPKMDAVRRHTAKAQ